MAWRTREVCEWKQVGRHRIKQCRTERYWDAAAAAVEQARQQAAAQAAAQQKALVELEAQRIAAEKERQRINALNAENTAAYGKMQESFNAAKSKLPNLTRDMASRDLARLQDVRAQYVSAGGAATGGGADLGAIRQQALANIGAGTGSVGGSRVAGPASTNSPGMNKFDKSAAAANLMVGGKDVPVNRFNLPNISGLSFGGS